MKLLVDFHCHIYPNYDLRKALLFARKHADLPTVLFLTERHDCNYFESFVSGKTDLGSDLPVTKIDENCCKISNNLFIVRGRQYASIEGIEVLSLFAAPKLEEKLPARDYCHAISGAKGLIAFSWAFGKWRGKRSALIEKIALEQGSSSVLLLDSGQRPELISLPNSFAKLSFLKFKIFAGSDPLPLKSNESKLGSFMSMIEPPAGERAEINSEILKHIIAKGRNAGREGDHCTPFEFLRDQVALRL